MADIFFIAIGLYILYKLLFEFIVPVYKTSAQVKDQFRNMRHGSPPPQDQAPQSGGRENKKEKIGEYIDFEEVKKP